MEYIHPETNKKTRPYIGNVISFFFDKTWHINSGYEQIGNNYYDLINGILVIK